MIPRRALATSLALSLVIAARPARAADPAPRHLDAVYLKNGSFVRGTIVEYLPDRSVTIRSAADGQTLRYPWTEIATTTLAPPVTPPLPEVFGEDDAPRLHVTLTRPARVHLHELLTADRTPRSGFVWAAKAGDSRYRIRCAAPCDTVIDGRHGRRFFFAGADDMPRSRTFSLAGLGPSVRARVHPGSRMRMTAGIIGTPLGAAGVVLGSIFLATRVERRYVASNGQIYNDPMLAPGLVLLGLGAALLAGGITMLVTGRTRVELVPAKPRGRPAPPAPTPAPITLR